MALVEKGNYGDYSSDNYGAHCIAIRLGARVVYFSYNTIIAFQGENSKGKAWGLTLSRNRWSNTTGKHLNALNRDKKSRLEPEQFMRELAEFLE